MPNRESRVEAPVVRYAKKLGCLVYKLHESAAPDRLFITPDQKLFFIEFKQRGMKARPDQKYEHDRLRSRGLHVYVSDSVELGKDIIHHEMFGDALGD